MGIEHWIQIFGLLLGGGVIGAILNHRINWRKLDQTDFDLITKEYRTLIKEQKLEIEELRIEIQKVQSILIDKERTIKELSKEIAMLRASLEQKVDKTV